MENEEIEELDIVAVAAMIGVITKSAMFMTPKEIAEQSYDIAEAMMVESKKRKNESKN